VPGRQRTTDGALAQPHRWRPVRLCGRSPPAADRRARARTLRSTAWFAGRSGEWPSTPRIACASLTGSAPSPATHFLSISRPTKVTLLGCARSVSWSRDGSGYLHEIVVRAAFHLRSTSGLRRGLRPGRRRRNAHLRRSRGARGAHLSRASGGVPGRAVARRLHGVSRPLQPRGSALRSAYVQLRRRQFRRV
jgi:hypothetical protein